MQPDAAHALRQRTHSDVLGKDELLEALDRRLQSVGGNVQEDHAARLEYVQVGVHAALRRQPRRVATRARGQRQDVVGQQTLQVRGTILPRHGDLQARGDGRRWPLPAESPGSRPQESSAAETCYDG